MKVFSISLFILFFLFGCAESQKDLTGNHSDPSIIDSIVFPTEETISMTNQLNQLILNGNADNYLHWNQKKVDLLAIKLQDPTLPYHGQVWFEYCTQLLRAGQSRECIQELESHFDPNRPLAAQMDNQNYLIFDLLALAYLRTGEQENCQNAHTPFSCILPLKEEAFHQLKEGSSCAIQLYQDMYDRYPRDSYRWLINLGYMTLGLYPDNVPKKYLLTYPNWEVEQQEFPRFNEIAGQVNASKNGLSGGVSIDDFNGDGHLDLFITDYEMSAQYVLLLNDGKGSYQEHTMEAGLKGIVGGLNCIHGDYNNDGYSDIFILRGAWLGNAGNHPNSLLMNNGNGTFSDVTKSAGILSLHPTQTAAWSDYNQDGYLDLFIGNEGNTNSRHACELYTNNGNGTFTENSAASGLSAINEFVKGVTWGDINNDGWPDLFISCHGKNLLFKNNNGTFENISSQAGIEAPNYSFACWFFDVNNDGWEDLFVAGYDVTAFGSVADAFALELQGKDSPLSHPKLYINQGNETFTDQTSAYRLDKSIFTMGANYGDLDNDGYLDIYLGTGSPNFESVVPNRMFRNVDGKYFEEVTSSGGFGHIQKGHGIAFADLDKDGDQDIYAVMGGAFEGDRFSNVLFENPGFGNNWIVIQLEGITSNRSAIGIKIELKLSNNQKIFYVIGTGGSFGASSIQAEIGLGKAKTISELIIHWSNGKNQTFNDINANQKIAIKEDSNAFRVIDYTPIPFSKSTNHFHHH